MSLNKKFNKLSKIFKLPIGPQNKIYEKIYKNFCSFCVCEYGLYVFICTSVSLNASVFVSVILSLCIYVLAASEFVLQVVEEKRESITLQFRRNSYL